MDEDLSTLLQIFSQYNGESTYESTVSSIEASCIKLFSLDYHISIIDNSNSQICRTYPKQIVIIDGDKHCLDDHRVNSASTLKELLIDSQFARVRRRAIIPVITLNNRNICRSATLSVNAEAFFNQGVAKASQLISSWFDASNDQVCLFPSFPGAIKRADIELIGQLGVSTVFNLMVEDSRHALGVSYISSEKLSADDYSSINIATTPYPGCEFFTKFHEANHDISNLYFDWNQPSVDACFTLPKVLSDIDFSCYKEWDLVLLTQNYLKLILAHISQDKGGVLIHCISGWDRTALFISLLRLSLWADGAIHQSLSASEILYLTVAYDWFLFRHQLPSRIRRNEDVFLFCFKFLDQILDDSFRLPSVLSSIKSPDPALSTPADCRQSSPSHMDIPSSPPKPSPPIDIPRSQSVSSSIDIPNSQTHRRSTITENFSADSNSSTEVVVVGSLTSNLSHSWEYLAAKAHTQALLSPVSEITDCNFDRSSRLKQVRSLFLQSYSEAIESLD